LPSSSQAEICRAQLDFIAAKDLKEQADEFDRLLSEVNKDLDPKWSLISHLKKNLLKEPESWMAMDLRFIFDVVGPDLLSLIVLLQSVTPDTRKIVNCWLEAVGIPSINKELLSANIEALQGASSKIFTRAKSVNQLMISSTGLIHLIRSCSKTKPQQVPTMKGLVVAWTSLHEAAAKGRLDEVQTLVERQWSIIEPITPEGMTPLHVAAEAGFVDVVAYLVGKGANIHAVENEGHTPLLLAAAGGRAEVIEFLVENGADIQASTSHERLTPLHLAALMGEPVVVKYLVDHGAKINAGDKDYDTPLHLASANGHVDVVKLLVESWASINALNRSKETPLKAAAENGHQEVVEFLKTCGSV